MRILLDHGAYQNLGDIAMVEGAHARVRLNLPDAKIAVVDRGFASSIWNLPNVARQPEYIMQPFLEASLVKLPWLREHIFWRHKLASLYAKSHLLLADGSVVARRLHSNYQTMTLREYCEPFNALHIAGGDFMGDAYSIELYRKCCLIRAFAEQHKPVVMTGQQLGPIRFPLFEHSLLRALRDVNFVGIREPLYSPPLCKRAGLGPSRFALMGDDSFGTPAAEDSAVGQVLSHLGLGAGEYLVFNLRIARVASEHRTYVRALAGVVDGLAQEFHMPVLMVPIGLYPSAHDSHAARRVAQFTRAARMLPLDDNQLTPALVKGVIGKAFGAVGPSWHFCNFALSQGVPAVCVHAGRYYADKARALVAFWQDQRLALSLEKVRGDAAVAQITQVFSDGSLRSQLASRAQSAIDRWQQVFDSRVPSVFQ